MVGLTNVDNTTDIGKPVSTAHQAALDLKADLANPTFTGTVGGITKAMVGLTNVDDTSDADKQVSTAQQAELDLKAPLANPQFTGTVGGITKAMVALGNVDNTSDADKQVSTAQQAELDRKANLAGPTFTGQVGGISKGMVGLGNVDNTSDTDKPVSTAQQAELDRKASLVMVNNFNNLLTKQPPSYIIGLVGKSTQSFIVNWQVPDNGQLAKDGTLLPIIDNTQIQVRLTGNGNYTNVTTVARSVNSYQFVINHTYGGIKLIPGRNFDVRVYGINQATTDGSDISTRSIVFENEGLQSAGPPNTPEIFLQTISRNDQIPIEFSCSDIDDRDGTDVSTLNVIALQALYTPNATNRDGLSSEGVILPNTPHNNKNQTQTFGFSYTQAQVNPPNKQSVTISDYILPGTSYNLQIQLKNDSYAEFGAFSTKLVTAMTKLPDAIEQKPDTITDCFNVSESNFEIYNGNTSSNDSTGIYINKATGGNILTFNQNSGNIIFECTNSSTDPSNNTTYGSKVDPTQALATLSVTAAGGTPLTAVPANATIYKKLTVDNNTNNDYFTGMSVEESYPDSINSGFRRTGKFSLSNVSKDYFNVSSNRQQLRYDLSGSFTGSVNVSTTHLFYVDNLGNPTASIAATTSTPTEFVYNCGIPSVRTFTIKTGAVSLGNINSAQKFFPKGNVGKVNISSTLINDGNNLKTTIFSQLNQTIVDDGNYTWSPGDITGRYFIKSQFTKSTNETINAIATNLKGDSETASTAYEINMFCDYDSFGKVSNSLLIAQSKCPTFYELNELDWTPVNAVFSHYSKHENAIKTFTPYFYDGEFTKSGSGYEVNYVGFNGPSGVTIPTYKVGNKTVAFNVTNPEDAIGMTYVNSLKTHFKSDDVSDIFITFIDNDNVRRWGNCKVDFDPTGTVFRSNPQTRSNIQGSKTDDNIIPAGIREIYFVFVL